MKKLPLKPLIVFIVVFSVLTVADAATTWWCIHRLGLDETNPLTDTTNLWTLLKPEVLALLLGALMMWAGTLLIFRRAGWGGAASFLEFRSRLLNFRSILPTMLLLVPLTIAIARILPVLNNLSFIVIGDSGFAQLLERGSIAFGMSYFRTYALANVLLFAVLFYPVAYLVHRWTRLGSW